MSKTARKPRFPVLALAATIVLGAIVASPVCAIPLFIYRFGLSFDRWPLVAENVAWITIIHGVCALLVGVPVALAFLRQPGAGWPRWLLVSGLCGMALATIPVIIFFGAGFVWQLRPSFWGGFLLINGLSAVISGAVARILWLSYLRLST